jgi:hypothetical protein
MHTPRHPRNVVPLDQIAERIAREHAEHPTLDAMGRPESAESLAKRAAYERAVSDPRNSVEPTPELIQKRIRTTAVVPSVLTIGCEEHHADAGQYCFTTVRGTCAARVKARAALR